MESSTDCFSLQPEPVYEAHNPVLLYVNSEPHKALLRILAEQVATDIGEVWLWLAVIGQAFFDAFLCVSSSPQSIELRDDALDYLASRQFEQNCISLGLDPIWVKTKMQVFADLAADQRQLQRRRRVERVDTRFRRKRERAQAFWRSTETQDLISDIRARQKLADSKINEVSTDG